MATTIADILSWVERNDTNHELNITVLGQLLGDISAEVDWTKVTALTNEVKSGKKFYNSQGNLVEGSLVPLDTSDATATAADIALGKTAYVNGVKITGTKE